MVCMTNLTSVITIHQHPSAGWFPSPRFVKKKNSTPSDIRTYLIIITTTTIIILYFPISTATNWGYNGVYNGVSPVLKLYPHPKNTPLINWPSYLHICCWYKSSKVYSINIYIYPLFWLRSPMWNFRTKGQSYGKDVTIVVETQPRWKWWQHQVWTRKKSPNGRFIVGLPNITVSRFLDIIYFLI